MMIVRSECIQHETVFVAKIRPLPANASGPAATLLPENFSQTLSAGRLGYTEPAAWVLQSSLALPACQRTPTAQQPTKSASVILPLVIVFLAVELIAGRIARRFEAAIDGARELHIAQLEKETASAKLALKRLTTDRVTLLTPENRAVILQKLTPFLGTKFDTGAAMNSGGQADFLWEFRPLLQTAGWELVTWIGPGGTPLRFGDTGLPGMGAVAAQDVEIHVHPQSRATLGPAASALVAALNEIGIAAIDRGFNAHSSNVDAIHILVGERR
jgi:hypothetical protein